MKITLLLCTLTLASSAFAQAPLYDVPGTTGENMGAGVAAVGDLDHDGFGDFAVGASRATGLQPDAGRVTVISGRTHAVLLSLAGERTGDLFGWSIAGLGDINGDSVGDLVVGAPGHEWTVGTDRGAVYVFSGASGAQIWKLGGDNDGDKLGWAVAAPGDVNHDGVPDFAFSEPWGDFPGVPPNVGAVWIHSGASNALLRLYAGQGPGELMGFSLDAVGDLNGDAVGDLVAGAPLFDAANFLDAGRGRALSGAASGQFLFTITGATPFAQLGYSAAGVSDVNLDGVPEVAFGEPFCNAGGVNAGRLRVYSGATQAVLRELVGAAGDKLGWSVDGLDDFDSDGRGDVIVGMPGVDLGAFADAGDARVYSVQTGAVIANTLGGYHASEGMGWTVGSAGDLNADGVTDAMSGSPSFDGNFPDGGRARIVLGSAPVPTTYCVAKVNSAGCTPAIGFTGCASISVGDNFGVHALNVLLGVNGLMVWSLQPNAAPFYGGTLCVHPPVRRTPIQTSYDDPYSSMPCPGAYYFHFSHAYLASVGMLAPGIDIYTQYWSRDSGFASPNNIGLTNGLRFITLP